MSALRFRVVPGDYAISRLPLDAPFPPQPADRFHCTLIAGPWRTVYGPADSAPRNRGDVRVESGWALLELDGSFGFDEVGIVAAWTAPLARVGIPLMALSSFDTDYLLVKQDRLAEALAAWSTAGIIHLG